MSHPVVAWICGLCISAPASEQAKTETILSSEKRCQWSAELLGVVIYHALWSPSDLERYFFREEGILSKLHKAKNPKRVRKLASHCACERMSEKLGAQIAQSGTVGIFPSIFRMLRSFVTISDSFSFYIDAQILQYFRSI